MNQLLSFRTRLLLFGTLIITWLYLFNLLTYQYHAASYLSFIDMLALLPGILLYIFSYHIKSSHPNLAFILEALWIIIIVSLFTTLFSIVIQYTPLTLQDEVCLKLDELLKFNIITIVNWIHQFPKLIALLKAAYNSIMGELVLAPIVLALLQQRRQFDILINVCLITTIIGFTFYYFFPTSAPAHILSNAYFTELMYSVSERFYDIQHHIPNDHIMGGIIGLPSFHAIWAIMIVYSFKNYKILFYILLVWNSLIMASILTLGWHFLVDIIASFILVAFAIRVAEQNSSYHDIPYKAMLKNYKIEFNK